MINAWLERRERTIEYIKKICHNRILKREWLISMLGRRGIARRTAIEYINSLIVGKEIELKDG